MIERDPNARRDPPKRPSPEEPDEGDAGERRLLFGLMFVLVVMLAAVGALTFVFRYAMIGLFAGRTLPRGLLSLCRHIAPASFAALAASELFIHAGEVAFALAAPKPWAALVAALVAWRTGNVLATIAVGMAALYLLKALL